MNKFRYATAIKLLSVVFFFTACVRSASGNVPPIPADLVATGPLETQLTLSWAASSGATGYNIYRGTSAGGETLFQSNVQGTSYEDSGLGNDQTYYYEVTAVNGSGESGKSSEVSATTKPAPTAMINATPGDSRVTLSWNASPTTTVCHLYRDTLGGYGGATNFLVSGTSYTDTNLVNGTTYYYQVGQINGSGENYDTGVNTAATPVAGSGSEAPASAPANLAAQAGNRMVLLNWSPVSNASTYNVYRGVASNAETLWQTGVVAVAFSDTLLTNGTVYYYKVCAVNAGQAGALSGEVSATPFVPAAPASLAAQAASGQVVLTWTNSATTYAVYRGVASGSETLLDAGLTGTTFTDTSVVNGTSYFYKIQCFNNGGSSPLSAEVSATPSGPAALPWSGTINFSLPGEPVQSCTASISDLNRPVLFAMMGSKGPNMLALAQKYNAINFSLDGFADFNFNAAGGSTTLTTTDDTSHPVCVIDYRWPQLSAQRIQALLTAAAQAVPSHPEIKNTGIVIYGFSEGVDNINLAIAQSNLLARVLAAVHLSEIDEALYNPLVTMDTVPHLFLASGVNDGYSTLNYGMEDFPSVLHDVFSRGLATTQGAPLTVLNNVGVGHGGNPDHPFISLWLDSVLSQRLPATLPVSAPVNLPGWQGVPAWVGTYNVTTNNAAPWNGGVQTVSNLISARFAYPDPRPFTWLPSQNNASAWLAYVNNGYFTNLAPVITSPTNAAVTVGKAFDYEVTAMDDPAGYGATNLPAGLSLDPTNGVISGTPAASGIFPITITAENGLGTSTATLMLAALTPYTLQHVSVNPMSGGLTMSYNTLTGQNYTIQATTNFFNGWTTVSNLTASGSTTTNTLPALLLNAVLGAPPRPQTYVRVCAP